MREIRDRLNELDKAVKMNLKLKTELKMKSEDYWKNTHKALDQDFRKISQDEKTK